MQVLQNSNVLFSTKDHIAKLSICALLSPIGWLWLSFKRKNKGALKVTFIKYYWGHRFTLLVSDGEFGDHLLSENSMQISEFSSLELEFGIELELELNIYLEFELEVNVEYEQET